MKNKNYIDIHVIQNIPPNCINRDDTGSPKTAMYGGTMRARVSSQAWKHSMREMFSDVFAEDQKGYRTKNVVDLVAEEICNESNIPKNEDLKKTINDILELGGVKAGDDKKGVLFFISKMQIKAVAKLVLKYQDDDKPEKEKKKEYKKLIETALINNPSVDILLFGRMAASNPTLNFDAASQVAHSISTHTVTNEYDYFTAVDDCSSEENTGAGHLGTVEFNSATLYRYATVNIGELAEKLNKEELKAAIRGFVEAFIRSMPTGKQNTFANRTLPNVVYVAVRNDQPLNFAGAFEKPVLAGNDGYVEKSAKELLDYAKDIYATYADTPVKEWIVGKEYDQTIMHVNLKELLDEIEKEMESIEYISI